MGARPTSRQETVWQHDALDELGVKVFEEKLAVDARPALAAAIDRMRPVDLLPAQEVDRLGRNLPDGLVVLNDVHHAAYIGLEFQVTATVDRQLAASFYAWRLDGSAG